MQALKALVIVMAVLIVAGVGIIVVTLVKRSQQLAEEGAAPAPAAALRAFGEGQARLPEGARIVDMVAEGERLILRLSLAGGGERLVLIDMGTGKTLGVIGLGGGP